MSSIEPLDWERISSLKRPDEQILWTGRPDPSKIFNRDDLLLVPFSVAWCAFAVFWEFGVASIGAPAFFELWGAMFVLTGLYFVFGRFVVKRYRYRRTVYALTTQRAIVVNGVSQVKDMPVTDQPVSVRRSRDGRHATVVIGGATGWAGTFAISGWPAPRDQPFGFFDVRDPDPMLRALESTRRPRLR